MQGTEPDANLSALQAADRNRQDQQLLAPQAYGQLVRMFDYYLSAVGEADIDAITRKVNSEIDQRLSPVEAKEAKRLLTSYLSFKNAMTGLEENPAPGVSGMQAVRQRLLSIQKLRKKFFSPVEIDGMFGFDDSYDQDAIARLEINQSTTLNDAQKKEQLAALDASMPAALREQREAERLLPRLQEQTETLRANGASEDDIYRMRAKEVGPAAAGRLADVDRDEQVWQSRIAAYLDERKVLLNTNGNLPAAQREEALAQLQTRLFNAQERPRLMAYEMSAATVPSP